jgi:signal transduction histidine kinase/ligand-binding sensor domain-containing protein
MPSARSHLVCLWLFLFGGLQFVGAQQPSFRHFGLRDGLPQSEVTALLEDHHGFLWVGTYTGGVARLGASGFRTFSAPQGLQALFVQELLEAPDGAIWVASQQGIAEIRGEQVLNYGPEQGIPAAAIQSLALDAENRVLVGNRHGLFRKEGDRFSPVVLPGGWNGRPIRFLAHDQVRGLWLGDDANHVARWDAQGLLEYPLPAGQADSAIRDLKVDPQGRAWVLRKNALLRMDRGHWIAEALPAAALAAKMLQLSFDPHSSGYLITLGGGGLLVKEAGGTTRILDARAGLPRDRIMVAIRDHRGVLWIGSDGDGLAAQALPDLLTLDNAAGWTGKDLGAISGVLELPGQRFLLASGTGLYLVEEPRGVTRRWAVRDGLPADDTWALLADGQGGAWIGTDRGLAHWKDGRVTAAGPREMARASVLTLTRHGDHLLAGTDDGVFELDRQGRLLNHLHLPSRAETDLVTDILPRNGRLLLGTDSGLWELKDGHLQRAFPGLPWSSESITTLTTDRRGHLWVGTMKGLHLSLGDRWVHIGTTEGLPDEGINFIVDVGAGRMAIGHNKGVSILDGNTLHHLSRNQGLISEETNHGGALVDSRGRLWIGMIGGVCILPDSQHYQDPPLPPPALLSLRWPGSSQPAQAAMEVSSQPDFLDFTFDTGAPLASSRLRYEALLQGVDSGWQTVNQGLSLQYRNMGAGLYDFRLRATRDGHTWLEAPPVAIRVLPAWHERWLVRGLLAVLLLALLTWVVWLRMHTLARRAQALEETVESRTLLLAHQNWALEQAHGQIKRSLESRIRLLDMVTHDLRSPLTSILLSLDRLRDEAPENGKLLDIMEREAHRIEALARNLLDQSRSKALLDSLNRVPILPVEVTEGFEDVLRLKAEAKGLRFRMEGTPEADQVRICADTATLQQVMLNFFENALKFTPAGGQVGIRSRVDRNDNTWSLEVWDTGRGLEPEKIQEILQPFGQNRGSDAAQGWGLGLSICQEILEAHQGTLQIESEPGQGARFRMILPLQPVHP